MNTNGQDRTLQAALDRAKQFSLLASRVRLAAFVCNVIAGAVAASGLDVVVMRFVVPAGHDPYWWVLGINLVLLLAFGVASIRYTMLNRRLCALQLSGQS